MPSHQAHPSSLEARNPGLGYPPRVLTKCSDRRGKGVPSKLEGPTGVEARGGEKTGRPEETPREVRSPDGEKMKNSYL